MNVSSTAFPLNRERRTSLPVEFRSWNCGVAARSCAGAGSFTSRLDSEAIDPVCVWELPHATIARHASAVIVRVISRGTCRLYALLAFAIVLRLGLPTVRGDLPDGPRGQLRGPRTESAQAMRARDPDSRW